MNLGQLDEENEKFINNYKALGYATKTQMANEAIALLRRVKARKLRAGWLKEAFAGLKGEKPDLAFGGVEGEDFVDKSW